MLDVVHVINALPNSGGAERLLLDISRTEKSWRMRIITWLSPDISLCSHANTGELEVLALRPFSLSKFRQAKRWLQEADLVHSHLFPSLYLGAFLPGPRVYTEHSTWNRRREIPALRFLDRFIYSRYDHVIAISEATRTNLTDWLSPTVVPVTTIDNGVSLARFTGSKRSLNPNAHVIRLGMAGSFSKPKNQDLLVRALVHLPESVHLIFAGEGPRKAIVEALAYDLNVATRITFLGNVDDIPAYYRGIDVYIQASHWEGFGLTLVEAMASGLPCLASNVPGLAEVVNDREMLFDNEDIQGLVSKLQSLISSANQYQSCSQYSLERASLFSIEQMVDSYLNLYESILPARKD